GRIAGAVLRSGDAEGGERHRGCRSEETRKAFRTQHVAQDRESRHDHAARHEAYDVLGHGCPRTPRRARPRGLKSLSTAAASAKPASTSVVQWASRTIRVRDKPIASVCTQRRGAGRSNEAREASAPM